MRPQIFHGDCLAVMKQLIADGVQCDSAVMDPPYYLQSIVDRFGDEEAAPAQVGQTGAFSRASAGFMGQEWDGRDKDGRRVAFEPEVWRLVYQLLRPGAFLLAFGHPSTQHRLVCAIEDAGFEIRDQIGWAFASGFPKSRDVARDIDRALGVEPEQVGEGRSGPLMRMSGENKRDWHARQAEQAGKFKKTAPVTDEAKQWEDWRTAFKPAWEPICVARKPLDCSSVARNVLKNGTGALNIGAMRVPFESAADRAETVRKNAHAQFGSGPRRNQVYAPDARLREDYDARGRWPGNFVHDGSPEVTALFPKTAPARKGKARAGKAGAGWTMTATGSEYDDDGGSAARFFFSAKADSSDRVNRCRVCGTRSIKSIPTCHPDDVGEPQVTRHPTVKPLDLMRWLVKGATPPGGLVLDCFAGTGSTGIAADREGMRSILIEQSADFVGDIEYRLAELGGENTPLFGGARA